MDLALEKLAPLDRYKLLIGLVIPRPIGWLSTVNAQGVTNCAPFSFFNVFSEAPPLCLVSFNPRSDGQRKHSLQNILDSGEFVVNLVDEAMANAMHQSSTEYEAGESEFEKCGLTPAPAARVKHPRIAEAAACLECKVERHLSFGPARDVIIGEILLVHAREGIIDPATRRVSEEHYKPVGRLFGNRYCTTRQRFNLPGELP
jgi:flavin reductase (DIM6/NTAB) family NADH-FMN oxidoreductase RutF